jgi:serine/threonine protein kinase
MQIALQVCSGLIYLSKMKYIHRDIASRNVLLTENLVAKLGDFGLCCQMDDNGQCIEEASF